MGKKRKTFRRVKVSNRSYVSGKRLQGFGAYEKKQKPAEQSGRSSQPPRDNNHQDSHSI